MSNLAPDSAIRAIAQKTVIEIPSDDSDDSDIDMDSESDGESGAADTGKKVSSSPGASSIKSRLISPPTTATTGSPSCTASQHSQTASVTHSIVQDSATDDEELTQILKVARKARAQKAPEEQLAPAPAPVLPLPDLSVEIRAAFGDQIKSKSSFFIIDQPSQSMVPQPEAISENKTKNGVEAASKRKAPYDPFAEHILNIENAGDVEPKKKRKHDKKRDRPRTNSQVPHGDTQLRVTGHNSTFMASQDPKGQRHGPSCLEQTPAADARRSRPQSLSLNLPVRPRAASVDPAAIKRGRRKGNLDQLAKHRNDNLDTILPNFERHQPSRQANGPNSRQQITISLEEDEEVDPVRFSGTYPSITQPVEVVKRQRVKDINVTRNRSGSGVLSSHSRSRRSPATPNQVRNVRAETSQVQSNDLQGRIGGRPERRPAYARKGMSHLDQAIKKAKSRQLDSGRISKGETLHKPPSQQPRMSANPAAEARLMRAQGTSTWRAAPARTLGKSSQKPRDGSSGFRSDLAVRSESTSLFRPNKNSYAYHQLRIGDDDEHDDGDHGLDQSQVQPLCSPERNANYQSLLGADELEDKNEDGAAELPQSIGGGSACWPNRNSRLPPRPSSQSNRSTVYQPLRIGNDKIVEYPRRNADANASKTSRKIQPPVEDWDQTAKDMAALRKQYEEKPRAIVVDALPPTFGMSDPAEIRQHNRILGRERARIRDDFSNAERKRREKALGRRKARKTEITREVRKKLGHLSEHFQNGEIEKRFNAYLEKHHPELSQPPDDTVVRGAQFNENLLENRRSDNYVHNDPDDDLNRQMIPASEALRRFEPNTPMSMFTVFVSDPHGPDDSEDALEFTINDSFDVLAKANEHARSILYREAEKDYEFKTVAGFATGKWELSTRSHKGKWRSIKTHEVETFVSDLPPDALRNKFVDEELLDKYARDAYDVFLLKLAPQDFWEEEAKKENNSELCKRQEEKGHKRQRERKGTSNRCAAISSEGREETPTGFEGDELRRALARGPPGTFQTDADAENIDDDEESPSDNCSQASNDSKSSAGTACAPTRPGSSYDQTRGNAYSDLCPNAEVLATFTKLSEANKAALKAARSLWEPRGAWINSRLMWKKEVMPYITAKEKHVDSEEVNLILPGLASAAGRDLQSWGFTCSRIWVQKRNLQGPMNLEIDFTLTARDREQATCASREVDEAAKNMDQAMVEVERHGETSAQAAVAGAGAGEGEGEVEGEGGEDSMGQNYEAVELSDAEMSHQQPPDESDVSEEE